MQIQSQNPGKCQPNFQALRISSVTKGSRKIDIYSLTSKDKFFAEKMLNIAKGQKFSEDSKLLGAPSVRNVYDTALKKLNIWIHILMIELFFLLKAERKLPVCLI